MHINESDQGVRIMCHDCWCGDLSKYYGLTPRHDFKWKNVGSKAN